MNPNPSLPASIALLAGVGVAVVAVVALRGKRVGVGDWNVVVPRFDIPQVDIPLVDIPWFGDSPVVPSPVTPSPVTPPVASPAPIRIVLRERDVVRNEATGAIYVLINGDLSHIPSSRVLNAWGITSSINLTNLQWEQVRSDYGIGADLLMPPGEMLTMRFDTVNLGTLTRATTITGWAVDLHANSGTGVNGIHIYLDNPGPDSGYIGEANYGLERPDIADLYGEAFRYSGFNFYLDVTTFSEGAHGLYGFAFDTHVLAWSRGFNKRIETMFVYTRPALYPLDILERRLATIRDITGLCAQVPSSVCQQAWDNVNLGVVWRDALFARRLPLTDVRDDPYNWLSPAAYVVKLAYLSFLNREADQEGLRIRVLAVGPWPGSYTRDYQTALLSEVMSIVGSEEARQRGIESGSWNIGRDFLRRLRIPVDV